MMQAKTQLGWLLDNLGVAGRECPPGKEEGDHLSALAAGVQSLARVHPGRRPGPVATPAGRIPECASAGASATARSLAQMYAYLSLDGSLDGQRLVSPHAVDRFAEQAIIGPSAITPEPEILAEHPEYASIEPIWERWGLGYRLNVLDRPYPHTFGPEESAFGMPGAGAQLGFADRVNRVSVGFVRNHMSMTWHASDQVVDALYRCIGISPGAHGA